MGHVKDKLQYELNIRQGNLMSLYELVETFYNQPNYSSSFIDMSESLKNVFFSTNLYVPSIYSFLPHLVNTSIEPAYKISKRRSSVDIVLGIPTVQRDSQNYLINTLQSLINGIEPKNISNLLIVIFVGETDSEIVLDVIGELRENFAEQIEDGLIDIISPPSHFYPAFDNMSRTLGDSKDRFSWRSKQCLDFVYLMMYCQHRGTYYVQLEDDVIAKKGYFKIMLKEAGRQTIKKPNWFILHFSQLGFIGKMFKSIDLPLVIQFFLTYYTYRPVDWLLTFLLSIKACQSAFDNNCKNEIKKYSIVLSPSLFQHVGLESSLSGKTQKLKDGKFGKLNFHIPHKNPPAKVSSNIDQDKKLSLDKAYGGKSVFFGLPSKIQPVLKFTFNTPLSLAEFSFQTGDYEHPHTIITNGTVEGLPVNYSKVSAKTENDYILIGQFNENGIAKGKVNPKLGKIKSVRLRLFHSLQSPVILKEIYLKPAPTLN